MPLPTILITLMGLDIGGAETHAVVLCKNLKDLGYNIIVASNGGVYEKELIDYGIKHYQVSLNTKRPWQVAQSFFKLMNIVKQEKVDLIHAHARIPAFICNIVSKLQKVKFITTSHAKFRSNFLLRLISVWGEKTIAVSEDIRVHLTDKFKVNKENITIITNGIDTEEFKNDIGSDELLRELEIDNQSKKIVWVSRIDESLADTISKLINSLNYINKEFENLSLIIVGSGDKLSEIQEKCEKKNIELNKKIVYAIGRRTDISKILNISDVFVGISRAALEAMACEKPVILAGPWSFVGSIKENDINQLKSDNFTGREFSKPVTSELLADSIKSILNMNKEDLLELGKLERQIVLENYSAKKMAEETAKVYKNVIGEK